jgi:hypothetical protein
MAKAKAKAKGEIVGNSIIVPACFIMRVFYAVLASASAALDEIGHSVFRVTRLMLREFTSVCRFYESL